MRKLVIFLTLYSIQFFFSCSSDDENPKLDISITGVENISLDFGTVETIPINVAFNNDVDGNVSLTLTDVPAGIEWDFSQSTGSESFTTNLELSTTNEAEDGNNQVRLIGETSDGNTIEKVFTLTVVKDLSISFLVLQATSWTIDDPEYQAVSEAQLTLLDQAGELIKSFSSDEDGKVMIYNLSEGEYYVQVESESLTFLAQQEEINGETVGYLINGVFENQEDIDSSPNQQPTPDVGDIKYIDLNGDFIVNESDKISGKRTVYDSDIAPMEIDIYLIEKE